MRSRSDWSGVGTPASDDDHVNIPRKGLLVTSLLKQVPFLAFSHIKNLMKMISAILGVYTS